MRNRLSVGVSVVVILLMAQILALAVILPPKTVTLTWQYPLSSPDIVFNVYHSTNAALPLKQWLLMTNVSARTCSLTMQPGDHFFVVAASNRLTRLQSPL